MLNEISLLLYHITSNTIGSELCCSQFCIFYYDDLQGGSSSLSSKLPNVSTLRTYTYVRESHNIFLMQECDDGSLFPLDTEIIEITAIGNMYPSACYGYSMRDSLNYSFLGAQN